MTELEMSVLRAQNNTVEGLRQPDVSRLFAKVDRQRRLILNAAAVARSCARDDKSPDPGSRNRAAAAKQWLALLEVTGD